VIAALAIHHPQAEHVDEWIAVMRQTAARSSGRVGFIDITGYRDTRSNRLVAISRWDNAEALAEVLPSAIDGARQLDERWGERPTDVLVLRLI
jgi:heme-degrading monooxygenase HmoA